jgi:anti-sigma regulatory factor (Ser/Thr protein kinase)
MRVNVYEAEFARDLSQLVAFRGSIASWLDAAGIDRETRNDIVLASHEALANAMEHGQEELVKVHAEIADDSVTVSVSNAGDWRPPIFNDHRGRGLIVIRALMTNVDVDATSNVSVVMQRSLGSYDE